MKGDDARISKHTHSCNVLTSLVRLTTTISNLCARSRDSRAALPRASASHFLDVAPLERPLTSSSPWRFYPPYPWPPVREHETRVSSSVLSDGLALALSIHSPRVPIQRASARPVRRRSIARPRSGSIDHPTTPSIASRRRARTASAASFASRARRHFPSALSASAPDFTATTAPPTKVALATTNAAFKVQNGMVSVGLASLLPSLARGGVRRMFRSRE